MNTKHTSSRQRDTKPAVPPPQGVGHQFEEMPDPLTVVEHLTIPGFIRRAPHRFHIDEITRFGDKVARVAEALQVSYLTMIDRQLGQIRVFPVPLLTRVYQVMAVQFGWEQVVDAPALDDRKDTRLSERARKQLCAAAEKSDDPVIMQALATVMKWMDGESARMENADATAPSSPQPQPSPPLRSI